MRRKGATNLCGISDLEETGSSVEDCGLVSLEELGGKIARGGLQIPMGISAIMEECVGRERQETGRYRKNGGQWRELEVKVGEEMVS